LLEIGEVEFDQYLKNALGSELQTRPDQKQMRENTKFAWEISPQMAVHMTSRFILYNFKLLIIKSFEGFACILL
jgi:hypothetical protein